MKERLIEALNVYKAKALARKESYNLLPRPLNEEEVKVILEGLCLEGLEKESFIIFEEESLDKILLRLLRNEVKRGTFPSSYVKAAGLADFVRGARKSAYLSAKEALEMLKEMKGGAAGVELVKLLEEGHFVDEILDILQDTVLLNREEFDKLSGLASRIEGINDLMVSWAEKRFAASWEIPESYQGISIKVGDNITTDHLSPSKYAHSRTDQPLHALFIMEGREDEAGFLERLEGLKERDEQVILVAGEAFGEGSSRKSATYTILQVLGTPVEGEPEKKEGGVVLAKSIAPIYRNSLIASGVLPLTGNTDEIKEGDQLLVDLKNKKVVVNGEKEVEIELPIQFQLDQIAAGGINYFTAGNELQRWAAAYCKEKGLAYKAPAGEKEPLAGRAGKRIPQTLAQKIVALNRLDGKETIEPGETAEIRIRGVFSQDFYRSHDHRGISGHVRRPVRGRICSPVPVSYRRMSFYGG